RLLPKDGLIMPRRAACLLLLVACARAAPARAADPDPPPPSGPHPRLFMGANLAGFKQNAGKPGTNAAKLVARCQESTARAADYSVRGGADGDNWPGAAMACAFAYTTTGQAKYLTTALQYWKASLDDDQKIGDRLGCTEDASGFDWRRQWNGNYPPPPILVTVTHDTGYPIRWYGPYLALTYDWLHDAPGVDDALRTQTRPCLTAWPDP